MPSLLKSFNKKISYKIVLISVSALFLGYFCAMEWKKREALRNVSSLNLAKIRPSLLVGNSKHLSLIQVQIRPETELPQIASDEFSFWVEVKSNPNLSGEFELKLDLPSGIALESGESPTQFYGSSEPQRFHFVVSGFSREHAQAIVAQITTNHEGARLGGSAVLSSRPEESLEHLGPAMFKSAQKKKE